MTQPPTTPSLRVLITGGAGFVGTRIAHSILTHYPHWTIIISDIVDSASFIPDESLLQIPSTTSSQLIYVHLDVTSPTSCLSALKSTSPDIVIHTAGVVPGGLVRYGRTAADRVNKLNVGGTANIISSIRQVGIKFLVFTSSCTVITDDTDHDFPNYSEDTPYPEHSLIYGASKAAAERLVMQVDTSSGARQGTDVKSTDGDKMDINSTDEKSDTTQTELYTISIRPSVIFGEKDYQLIPAIAACISKGETPFLIGSGHNLFDFTYVDNIALAHLCGMNNLLYHHHSDPSFRQTIKTGRQSAAGLTINISNDSPITFRDFCLAVWAEYDHYPPYTIGIPKSLAYVAGAAAEIWGWVVGGRTTLCRGSVKDAVGTRYADCTRARELLCYHPLVSLQEGIRRSVGALKVGEVKPGDSGRRNRAKGFAEREYG